jgi:hypothetical protein
MALERNLGREDFQAARTADRAHAAARARVPRERGRRRPLRAPAEVAQVAEAEVRVQDVVREVAHVRGVLRGAVAAPPEPPALRRAHAAVPRAVGRRAAAAVVLVQVLRDPALDLVRDERAAPGSPRGACASCGEVVRDRGCAAGRVGLVLATKRGSTWAWE